MNDGNTLLIVLLICLLPAIGGILLRLRQKKLDANPLDILIDAILPLTITFVSVALALFINRYEADQKQKDTAVTILGICSMDVHNSIKMMEIVQSEGERLETEGSADIISVKVDFLNKHGLPSPEIIENLLLKETALTNTSPLFLETILRRIMMLEGFDKDIFAAKTPDILMDKFNKYHNTLIDIYYLVNIERKHILGEMKQNKHDNLIERFANNQQQGITLGYPIKRPK